MIEVAEFCVLAIIVAESIFEQECWRHNYFFDVGAAGRISNQINGITVCIGVCLVSCGAPEVDKAGA